MAGIQEQAVRINSVQSGLAEYDLDIMVDHSVLVNYIGYKPVG